MPANFAETNVGPWVVRTNLAIVSVTDTRHVTFEGNDSSLLTLVFNVVQIPGKKRAGVPEYRITGTSGRYTTADLPKYVRNAMASVVRRAAVQVHNAEFRIKTGGRG